MAVACPSDCVIPLSVALDEVVAAAVRDFPLEDENAELHGYELFQGKGHWAPLAGRLRARIRVYRDALAVFESFPEVQIFIRGIDRERQRQRYSKVVHPHVVVLGHLLERLDEHGEGRQAPILVVADEIADAKEHKTHQGHLWHYQRASTSGYRARKLNWIADTIHFAPSNFSRLLQLADLVAYLNFRVHSGRDKDPRAIETNEMLCSLYMPRVRHRLCWCP